jgi:prolyl-tRNA editing enzyme YbaK/EbsC (Cys-tRNA(Pro) deacylase)
MDDTAASFRLGTLTWSPAVLRPDLLAEPVALAVQEWSRLEPEVADAVQVAEIDPANADTAEMSEAYALELADSVNCVLVAGRREGEERVAAAVVRATTRADVNGTVRRLLDVRKASFWPLERAVAEAGMEYGGITPIGLPADWPVLIDPEVEAADFVVIGSGTRAGKLAVSGSLLAALPAAEVLDGLGQPIPVAEPSPPEPSPAVPSPAVPSRPVRAPDDSDVGWGERPGEPGDDDRRYLEDRPPHWGSD